MLSNERRLPHQISHVHLPLNLSEAPPAGEREFKDAMARLAFSIAVVTACHNGEEIGRTVTSFMALSAVPPRIMISIDVRSRLIDLIGACGSFSISFLGSKHETVGDVFAGKWQEGDRFGIANWGYWPSGNRKLQDAILSVDCELTGSIDAGDHMLFVGTIIETEISETSDRLLWLERGYFATASARSEASSGEGSD